jgi:hypothetical protein
MALPRQNTITMQTIASSRSNALGSLCIACSSPATVCENTQVCDRFLYSSESIVGTRHRFDGDSFATGSKRWNGVPNSLTCTWTLFMSVSARLPHVRL